MTKTCERCDGYGVNLHQLLRETCRHCEGTGEVERESMSATKKLTMPFLRQLLTRHGGTLKSGQHGGSRDCLPGEVCVRELRSVALVNGEWLSDHPDGTQSSPTDRACQILNDAPWSSDEARTEACLPLALLSESTAIAGWYKGYAEGAIRVSAYLALKFTAAVATAEHQKPITDAAQACANDGTEAASAASAASLAASLAASRAASAASLAASLAASRAASRAASWASWSASAASRAASAASWSGSEASGAAVQDAVLRAAVALLTASHETRKPWESPTVRKAMAEAEKLIPA